MKPLLLDLFCCAGGCSAGYSDAGFDVTGVDINPQPHYPFKFKQADAFDYLRKNWMYYDVIAASPPCQRYSATASIHGKDDLPDYVARIREALIETGLPYVIENVPGAPLLNPLVLCGSMFGLGVRRHRLFESNITLVAPAPCKHPKDKSTGLIRGKEYSTGESGLVCVSGHIFNRQAGLKAMGIDWTMTRHEVAQAIPPEYTRHIGGLLMKHCFPKP